MIKPRTPIDLDAQTEAVLERLRDVRERSHYPSLRQWAEHVHEITGLEITGSAIRRYELGLMRMPFDYLLAVALTAGLDGNWLLRGTGERLHDRSEDDPERLAVTLEDLAEKLRARGQIASPR